MVIWSTSVVIAQTRKGEAKWFTYHAAIACLPATGQAARVASELSQAVLRRCRIRIARSLVMSSFTS
jgi:hypothetical protein